MERIIDVGQQRYADREYAGPAPDSAPEAARQQRMAGAMARLIDHARDDPVVADILTVLGAG